MCASALAATLVGMAWGLAPLADAAPYGGPVEAPPPAFTAPAFPDMDAFYSPPQATIEDHALGEIIAARRVDLANLSVAPVNVDAWQVSYRSQDSHGAPIGAIATLIKPRGDAPAGGRKLLSYQFAEDSTGPQCAPSYALRQWSAPAFVTGQIIVPAAFLAVQSALAQGWAVVVPDHEGPKSAFSHGPLAARITLDGIRAAESFPDLQIGGTATDVALWGYSGGSMPTVHAAELAPSYAPELNIVGAAAGGVAADLGALVNNANGQLGAGIVTAGIIGLAHEEPDFNRFLRENINPLGHTLLDVKDTLCVQWNSLIAPFINIKGLFPGQGDPLLRPEAQAALQRTRMGQHVPKSPMYIYQSNPDWLVPVGPVNTLVNTYCQDPNARVTYTRDHFSEHLSMEVAAVPSVTMWLRDRYNGIPAPAGCSTNDVASIVLDQSTWDEWAATVGSVVASLTGQAIGSGR